MMQQPVILIGVGEMGGVFARGLLRTGHPVIPVTRNMSLSEVATSYPSPKLVLISVGENDLHPVLQAIPEVWQGRLGLLQNELLPRDWESYDYPYPSVISVWFEKKKGQDAKLLISSPAYGPQAPMLVDSLTAIGIPAHMVKSAEQMMFELVRKNVYILTTNIAGMLTRGNVDDLWQNHRELASTVANEIIDIQQWLTGKEFDRAALIAGLVEGIDGDLEHMCMGRSAPGRLQRALGYADEAQLAVKKLREIHTNAMA